MVGPKYVQKADHFQLNMSTSTIQLGIPYGAKVRDI